MPGLLLALMLSKAEAFCAGGYRLDPGPMKSDVTLLGESHGTREIPAIAKDFVCQIAAAGRPVILGLEIPRDEQSRIDKFIASDGSRSDVAALLSGPFWTPDPADALSDGRSSKAMFDLIDHARLARRKGAAIAVLAIDPGSDDYPSFIFTDSPAGAASDLGFGDRYMATMLETAHVWCPACKILMLVGETHATASTAKASPPYRTMLDWLRLDSPLTVTTVAADLLEGAAWQCRGPREKPICKEYSLSHSYLHAPEQHFDQVVTLQAVTASPPAKAATPN